MSHCLTLDCGDTDAGKGLSVSLLPAILLPALHLEHGDLSTSSLLGYFGFDGSSLDERSTYPSTIVIADKQDLIKRNFLAGLDRELFDIQKLSNGGSVLLTAGLYDCKGISSHLILSVHDYSPGQISAPARRLHTTHGWWAVKPNSGQIVEYWFI